MHFASTVSAAMRCNIELLLVVASVIALVDCENKNDKTNKKVDKRTNENLPGKRELSSQFNVLGTGRGGGAATAFSYTHVVQNHGKARKVIHVPGSDGTYSDDYSLNDHDYYNAPSSSSSAEHDYGSLSLGPTQEPYYGPIYVTAKPVLPNKETYGRSANLRTNDISVKPGPAPFSYPLFTPYPAGLDKQYTVPVQVVYRIPYQRSFGYQVPKSYPFALNNQAISYDNYPLASPIPYAISKPFLNHLQTSIPYSVYFNDNNNYLGYTKPEINTEEQTTNNYSSEPQT